MMKFGCGAAAVLLVELAIWLIVALPRRGEDLPHTAAYALAMLAIIAALIGCIVAAARKRWP